MDLNTFLHELQIYKSPLVFNPWRDCDENSDIGAEAPVVRTANLRRYLELRQSPHYLFIGEALGYQGGHFSGIAITSERILLGFHPSIPKESVLGSWDYRRTSDPESPLLNRTQKQRGFNEPTDTVVWNALNSHGIAAFDVILWNIFPFHPYKAGNLLTNRTPSKQELDCGVRYTRMLLELRPGMEIIAVGLKAAGTLGRYGIAARSVPHPSMGGAERFRRAVADIFAEADK